MIIEKHGGQETSILFIQFAIYFDLFLDLFQPRGDFIVPPGYPNDSYKMGVQSGERVQVTPAGQRSTDTADILAMLPGMIGRELSSALMRWGGRL